MSEICIDTIRARTNGVKLTELYSLLLVESTPYVDQTLHDLEHNGFLETDYRGYKFLTKWGQDKIQAMLERVSPNARNVKPLEEVAKILINFYPKGMMPGTQIPWRSTPSEIAERLRKFFTYYPDYTIEQVVQTTKKYVDSFNGNYKYMKLLKYFIFKNEDVVDNEGHVRREMVSRLAEWIDAGDDIPMQNFEIGELK